MALWQAWQQENAGDMAGAWAIRSDLIHVGQRVTTASTPCAGWMGLQNR